MKIGLVDVDSKIPNLALMKISAYHKSKGDSVEFFSPLTRNYDKVYASRIFKHEPLKYYPIDTICGGTGFSLKIKLDPEIEHIYPDYSLYKIDYAMGYLTRGCNNSCAFCVVPKKEGKLHKHAELEEFWRYQSRLKLLDNSLTDYKNAAFELKKIIDYDIKLNLTQGFNIRTIKPEIAELLSKIKLWDKNSQWHIAWDNINDENLVLDGIKILNNAGIKDYKIMCYVLVGFNSNMQEDLHRIHLLDNLGVDPFIMVYKKTNYTNAIAKWCNRKQLMKSCSFKEYFSLKVKNYGI
jgi:hypothetical protein